jgi:hypothetical protein
MIYLAIYYSSDHTILYAGAAVYLVFGYFKNRKNNIVRLSASLRIVANILDKKIPEPVMYQFS